MLTRTERMGICISFHAIEYRDETMNIPQIYINKLAQYNNSTSDETIELQVDRNHKHLCLVMVIK